MAERPECPYCGTHLTTSVPAAVEGSICVRCPKCNSVYTYTIGIGSFPIEDDLGLHISAGRFSARVSIGAPQDSHTDKSGMLSRLSVYACVCILIMIIIAIGIILMLNE